MNVFIKGEYLYFMRCIRTYEDLTNPSQADYLNLKRKYFPFKNCILDNDYKSNDYNNNL